MNEKDLLHIVHEVNAEQVAPEEVLTDNVYYFDADTGCVKMFE